MAQSLPCPARLREVDDDIDPLFLDAEGRPFWGGTYFPPEPRWGKPSFKHVLREVERIYREEPDKVGHNSGLIVEARNGRALETLEVLRTGGLEIRSFELLRPTLEETFMNVVRGERRDG